MRDELQKKIPKTLLDKEWVGKKLREFRERNGFATQQEMQKETGLTGLFRNEDGTQFPGWPALVKFVYACNRTMQEFFAYIEPQKPAGDQHPEETKRLHEILDLRKSTDPDEREAAEWIAGNLKTFHELWVVRGKRRK